MKGLGRAMTSTMNPVQPVCIMLTKFPDPVPVTIKKTRRKVRQHNKKREMLHLKIALSMTCEPHPTIAFYGTVNNLSRRLRKQRRLLFYFIKGHVHGL